ncbi:MAG TPA: carboxypeptidase-like regulatory domain-containing protein, partial [Thermoanaerobaculia bacterium]|nr:carboxypeptidase-like regulatory domain-containing protein [Thermoanaerobaculia bacterium]
MRYLSTLFLLFAMGEAGAQQRTAQLQIRWTSSVDSAAGSVSLLPVDVDLPSSLSRDEAIAAWTRTITAGGQTWEGLPPGTYRIVICSATVAADAAPPVDIGEVLLAPGERRTVSAVIPRRETLQRDIPINLQPADDSLTITQWHNGTPSKLSWRSGTPLIVPVQCAGGDLLQFQTTEHIGTAVLDSQCEKPISVAMAKRVDVVARIAVPAGSAMPSWGILRCGDTDIPFSVVRSRVEASVPKDCREVSLRASGFTPVTVPFAKDLGMISLRQSAAAATRVSGGRDGDLLAGVRVTAIRSHDVASMRSQEEIARLSVVSGVTDSTGWVRLAGLPEEPVVFVLHSPGRAYPEFSEPYRFKPGIETILDDLRLEPPANVVVTVSLAKSLESAVELRDVELSPSGHSHWPSRLPIRAAITPEGAVVEDVPPGKWNVSASGRLRNGFAIRAAETTVDVLPGVDAYVALEIHDTLYHGRITRDGQPVAGTVNLKPARRGVGRRAPVATAGADGTFLVLLEGEGDYTFFLQERSGGTVRLDRYIHFGRSEDEVVIELPDHHVRGRVIDGAGNAVAGASVAVTSELTEPSALAGSRSKPGGEFEIANVSSGTWSAVAETSAGRSEPVIVSVSGGDVDGLTLVLDPIRTVRVRVVDVTGAPVRDAILAAEFQEQPIVHMTNGEGVAEFRLRQKEQATPVSLVIAVLDLRLSCRLTR